MVTGDSYSYSSLFYEYQRAGSALSASRVAPLLLDLCRATSVLDVGCGAGAWVSAYRTLGVPCVLGVDGDYVDRSMLMVDDAEFRPIDISKPFDLGRQFGLVQCLEVAEHLPPPESSTLVENLVRHGQCIVFSAAPPGQGGEHHINERPFEYWRDAFGRHGYAMFDCVRPALLAMRDVEPWYRYNTFLFVCETVVDSLPAAVVGARLPAGLPIPDRSPIAYRLRKLLVRNLPQPWVTALAQWKHRRLVRAMARNRARLN